MPIKLKTAVPMFLVHDVPASLAFYRGLLGFEVIASSAPFTTAPDDFGWCMLRLGGTTLMLNNMFENNVRPSDSHDAAREKAHADTTLYCEALDLPAVEAHLQAKSISFEGPTTTWYGARQITLRDPDGYILCFQVAASAGTSPE